MGGIIPRMHVWLCRAVFTDLRVTVQFAVTRRPTRPSAPHCSTTNDSPARPRDWFTRPHRLTTSRPAHLSAPAAESAMIDLSFTMMIINSAVDNYWPDASGDIHPSLFLLSHVIFVKEQVYLCLGLQYCLCRATKSDIMPRK